MFKTKFGEDSRPLGLKIVVAFLSLEATVVGALALTTLGQILLGQSRSVTTALALFGMIAATSAALFLVVKGLAAGKRWARSAALFWQLVQLSIALGSFTGETPNALIGWALIVPSAVVLIAIFRKDVVESTMREVDRDLD